MSITFDELVILASGRAQTDSTCPLCSHKRKGAHRALKVLRIWDTGEILTYNCAHCGAAGWAKDDSQGASERPKREVIQVAPKQDRSALAQFLWVSSEPLKGSPAEAYLEARRCPVVSDVLRYLPARGNHPHAMVAQFWGAEGVHLTKLSPDGRSKAGTDKDKIMVGPSKGHPIRVYSPDDREELVITEGIEDAASFAVAMGWPAWAAGSAGRIPAVIPPHGRVYVAVDDDPAGRQAWEAALKVRSDLIPINVGKILKGGDANKVLQRCGPEMLVAIVEWSDTQYAYERGEIHRAAYDKAMKWAREVIE